MTDPVERIELLVAYAEGSDLILNITTSGKSRKFRIKKTTAASAIGYMAKALIEGDENETGNT